MRGIPGATHDSPVMNSSSEEVRFHGVGASPGIARGIVFVYRPEDDAEPPAWRIAESAIPQEIERFETALQATREQITELQQRISASIGAHDAGIFDAHLLMVEDPSLINEVLRRLKNERYNVEHIFAKVADKYAKTLSKMPDPYLRERAMDIIDVARRVVHNLMGTEGRTLSDIRTPHLLVAHNLTPSDTVQLDRKHVLGFACDIGSKTAHTAIMARALGIPAVVGLHDLSSRICTGTYVLLDGYNGIVILNPSDQTLWEYGELEEKESEVERRLSQLRETECKTLDGRHVTLSANIRMPDDVASVQEHGAEGIGLYRTEFFFLNRRQLPSEEEQYQIYREVAEQMLPNQVIFRTLDLGGDKVMSALNLPKETNPFLGWRAIRFCLDRLDVFKPQLRAILRASALGNVRMMYPLISSVDEVRQANAMLEECRDELRRDGVPFDEKMEVGAMIETPSAAMAADMLAQEVDFFSIGTNDLIQYTIAVDRQDERLAYLYEPTHPGMIRLLRMVVDAAHAHKLWVGLCGEMAGDVTLTPLLLGLGVDELSASASLVPRVKRAVQSLDIAVCLRLVEEIRHLDCAEAILKKCEEVARSHYGELL